jgi:hypothetical protein
MIREPDEHRTAAASSPRRATAAIACVLLLCTVLLAACGAAAAPSRQIALTTSAHPVSDTGSLALASSSEPACGPAAARTAAATALLAAQRIYRLELTSSEVSADRREVQDYQPLVSALAGADTAGVEQAVTKLVYSGTHIVRLRVVRAGHVLADVGGPYIIAPVSGSIRAAGRTLATYVLSVQDDLGYVKLEKRYVGVPMLLRRGTSRIQLEGEIPPGTTIPYSGPVSYRGGRFQAVSFTATAFPEGPLTVTLLVPLPPSSLGCGSVRVLEAGRIAQTMWRRYMLVSGSPATYAKGAQQLTGALVYVRSPSGHQVAGSTGAGPRKIPDSGAVRYRGRTYTVTSFPSSTASGQVRVYVLLAS